MNSIPLSSPDGTVYAYACGDCHCVPWGSYDRTGVVTVTASAAASKLTADKCCLCSDCKVVKIKGFGPCPACVERSLAEDEAARLKRVEKALNPEAALDLLEEMESYCRDSYGNNWLEDIEFDLHSSTEAVLSSGSQRHDTQKRLDSLRTTCGGWWTRQGGDDEPCFVTTAEWLEILAARQRRDGETT